MPHFFESMVMIGAYALVLIIVGAYLGLKENKQDFIIGNRQVGIIPTAGSMAASFRDGAGIAIWVSLGLAGGYGALWLFFGVALGGIFMMIVGPKMRLAAIENQHLTISETVFGRIGPNFGRLTALVTLAFGFAIIAIQFFVSGSIFSQILEQPQIAGVAAVGLLLVAYLVLGGYKSVIITDTIQFFLIISLIVVPVFLPIKADDYLNVGSLWTFPHADKIAYTIFGFFYIIAIPESWQRVYSAKDARTVVFAFPLMTVFLVIMTLSLIWMGMGLRDLPPESIASYAQPYLAIFDPQLGISPWFLGYVVMVFLAITMSTQSAACYVMTSTFNRIFRKDSLDGTGDSNYIRRSRFQIAAILFIAAIASLTVSNAINTLFDALSFFICIGPVYILAAINPQWLKKWPQRDLGLTLITLAGIVSFIAIFISGVAKGSLLISSLPALGVSLALAVLAVIKTQKAA